MVATPLQPHMISAPQVYRMLGNESLWQVAQQTHAALAQTSIPHAIMGGVAVCLHGYQRNCNRLNSSFARFLHKSLRPTFRELARRVKSDP
jgi:hypothetical protein